MRIVIDLPEWCDERHIRVMAGIEMAAFKLQGENIIHVKTKRCISCGSCCTGLSLRNQDTKDDGECKYLEPGTTVRMCRLKENRPFMCGAGPQRKGRTPNCSVEYEDRPIQ